MKPFVPACIKPEDAERTVQQYVAAWKSGEPVIRQQFAAADLQSVEKMIRDFINDILQDEIFINDVYQVNLRRWDEQPIIHLSIKRIDKKPIHDWRDLQEIKNLLVGPEHEAVEIYPAESRVVDLANQYHLWVFTDSTYRIPFGFDGGRAVSEISIADSVNRPRS